MVDSVNLDIQKLWIFILWGLLRGGSKISGLIVIPLILYMIIGHK